MRAHFPLLMFIACALSTSAHAGDGPPPPEAPASPADAPADADGADGSKDAGADKLKSAKLAPLTLPPDTEQADSGDQIGFVNVRFGVVTQGLQDFSIDNSPGTIDAGLASGGAVPLPTGYAAKMETKLQVLQLRAFGQLPLLEDSFFLINVRSELSPRISFALFQIPLGGGHYFNVNSGGGALSNALVVSLAKQPLLEPQFWTIGAFEQNNGAAAEVHGPLVGSTLRYRVFANGGAGQSTGNVGGQRITFNNSAYTYAAGGQLTWSPIGYYDRFDNPFMYKPLPLTVGFDFGSKYEVRAQERFPALQVNAALRWGRFEVSAQDYSKAELNFGQLQNAWSVMAGVLIVPQWLFFAVDGGQFQTTGFGALSQVTNGGIKVGPPPTKIETDLKKEVNETDARAALHFFFWKSNGVLSLRYTLKVADLALSSSGQPPARTEPATTHDVWLAATFRF